MRTLAIFTITLFLVSCAPTKPALITETVTPQLLENGWYRFTEQEAGYSIDYPPHAVPSISNDAALDYPQLIISLQTSNGYQNIQVIVYSNQEQLPVKEIVLQNVYQGALSQAQSQNLSLEPVEIAGLDAMRLEMEPFLPGLFISENDKVYFISLPVKMTTGDLPNSESIDLFYEIVNTFSISQ